MNNNSPHTHHPIVRCRFDIHMCLFSALQNYQFRFVLSVSGCDTWVHQCHFTMNAGDNKLEKNNLWNITLRALWRGIFRKFIGQLQNGTMANCEWYHLFFGFFVAVCSHCKNELNLNAIICCFFRLLFASCNCYCYLNRVAPQYYLFFDVFLLIYSIKLFFPSLSWCGCVHAPRCSRHSSLYTLIYCNPMSCDTCSNFIISSKPIALNCVTHKTLILRPRRWQ